MIDLRKNNGELRETKSAMRRHHDEEIVRMEREHEEKILFLLRQLANKDPAESNDISLNKDISDVEEVIKFQVRINFLYLDSFYSDFFREGLTLICNFMLWKNLFFYLRKCLMVFFTQGKSFLNLLL